MDKTIRKAVRTYLIKDNKVIVIKYKQHDGGYYDIPGGKKERKRFPSIEVIKYLKNDINLNVVCDSEHNILNIYEK